MHSIQTVAYDFTHIVRYYKQISEWLFKFIAAAMILHQPHNEFQGLSLKIFQIENISK